MSIYIENETDYEIDFDYEELINIAVDSVYTIKVNDREDLTFSELL